MWMPIPWFRCIRMPKHGSADDNEKEAEAAGEGSLRLFSFFDEQDVRELFVQTAKQTDDSPLCCGFEPAAQVVQFPQECFLRSG